MRPEERQQLLHVCNGFDVFPVQVVFNRRVLELGLCLLLWR